MPRGLPPKGWAGHSSLKPRLPRTRLREGQSAPRNLNWSTDMAWQKPQATDLRYGFEITMYISNR